MSNQEQNLNAWQQKRSEMQVNTDPQADWLSMQHILDQQMPVVNADAGNPNSGGSSNLGSHLVHLAKFKLLYVAIALVATTAITYYAVKHRAAPKANKPSKTEIKKDSLFNSPADTSAIDTIKTDKLLDEDTLTDSVNKGKTDNADKPEKQSASTANGNLNANGKKSTVANGKGSGISNGPRLLSSAHKIDNTLESTGGTTAAQRSANNGNRRSSGITNRGTNRKSASDYRHNIISNSDQQISSKTLDERSNQKEISQSWPSPILLNANGKLLVNGYNTAQMTNTANAAKVKNRTGKPVASKTLKEKSTGNGSLDWGLLLGVSAPESFAPKNQNNNFYGSLPVDAFTGLFVTKNFNNKWAVDLQMRLLIPNKANERYDHAYTTKGDTGQTLQHTFKIVESRKIYSAQVPVHLMYNITSNFSVKAGPVVNIPLKFFRVSSITPTNAFQDSTGYISRLTDTLASVKYNDKLSLGVSGGIGYTFRRLRLEATYYYSPQPLKVTSPFTNYSKKANNLQITVGFKINKPKP